MVVFAAGEGAGVGVSDGGEEGGGETDFQNMGLKAIERADTGVRLEMRGGIWGEERTEEGFLGEVYVAEEGGHG